MMGKYTEYLQFIIENLQALGFAGVDKIKAKPFDPETERMVKVDHRTWKIEKK